MQTGGSLSFEDQQILNNITGLAMSLGIYKSLYFNDSMVITHMPVSLYPYLISSTTFHKLKQAHYIWQKLFAKLVFDKKFISQLSARFCKDDLLMENMLNIYMKTQDNQVNVVCSRIDYMGDQDPKLVQYNLMSVGLNGMSDRVQNLHSFLQKYKQPLGKFNYPQNRNQQTLCKAFNIALKENQLTSGLILMITHQNQFNYGDQNAFKLQMLKQGRIVQSINYNSLLQKMQFDESTKIASIQGKSIDAFYFRTGYKLEHFPTQQHWILRQKIQKSCAVKLPSIGMILINSKRFQSQLAQKNVLTSYLTEQQAQKILSLNGQIYHFDNKTQQYIQKLIQKTKNEPYVLKPNREGGGNNFFGEEAYQKLKQIYQQKIHLKNYILMKKISSTCSPNYFIFEHKSSYVPRSVTEFSTFGCLVYKRNKIISNQMGGTLARIKRQEVNEGGIAINQGVIAGICIKNFEE